MGSRLGRANSTSCIAGDTSPYDAITEPFGLVHHGSCVMACRIGMSTNVTNRVRELKDEGKVPENASLRILARDLTYEEANARETSARTACGPHCAGQSGGDYKAGRVWSVYRLDW